MSPPRPGRERDAPVLEIRDRPDLGPNVPYLPHRWKALPSDSPLRAQYAEPPGPTGSPVAALGAVALGVALPESGATALGLLLLAGGVMAAMSAHRKSEESTAKRAQWRRTRICPACTERFQPGKRPPSPEKAEAPGHGE